MQHELRTQFMEANIVIKGIEVVIKRDLEKHKTLLERSAIEMLSFKEAVSHEIKKKKHYKSLLGEGKYNDDSLVKSMDMIAINIRHLSDKVKLSQDSIDHHRLIVDTLTKQLEAQNESLAKYYRDKDAVSN